MARFIKDRSLTKGQAPGSLILIGRQKMEKPVIKLMDYSSSHLDEPEIKNIKECLPYLSSDSVTWINIYGIHDLELIKDIGEIFQINPLLLENIMNTDQSPKYEPGEKYDAFIFKMLMQEETENRIQAEQITFILGEKFLLTLQEKPGDIFNAVRERIKYSKGRVRLNKNDYLAYALMDTIVDNYLLLIETIGRKIEELESKIFIDFHPQIAQEIYRHKTELSFFRKNIRPVREIMNYLLKSDDTYFLDETQKHLNELNSLVNQTIDTIELYSNMVSDQLNTHNSLVSNKMNQVMKVLTIFASIFIPLTFIAGVYGMNFVYMPELNYKYSYLYFWIVTIITVVGLFLFFRKKKWL